MLVRTNDSVSPFPGTPDASTSGTLVILFASTLFLSALLLFLVQPMIAKMLLPLFGGTPGVWNTCMVFFQGMLLAGYAYAHWLATRFSSRTQVALHAIVLLIAGCALPIGLSAGSSNADAIGNSPAGWLLRCLLIAAGLPFFAVATTGPLLQKWFSRLGHRASADPYFLYASSNAGSLLALVAYPAVLEPVLRLREQSLIWSGGFAGFIVLVLLCAWAFCRSELKTPASEPQSDFTAAPATIIDTASSAPVNARQRWRWTVLAFVPSSLLLAVTTYLTTDLASIPLLWVLPLALYLLTFILVFARRRIIPQSWAERALPIAAVGVMYLLVTEATDPLYLLIALHLAALFIASLACHGRLAIERPATAHLTEFYFWISLGGVLGGIFNALVAPLIFTRVTEYPLAIVLACLLCCRPFREGNTRRQRILDAAAPLAIAALTALTAFVAQNLDWPSQARLAIVFGPPLILTYATVDRPMRFALSLVAVTLASSLYAGAHGRTIRAERNFFGVLRVTYDPTGPFHRLVHGNTVHGRQFLASERRGEPLSYYHRTGPLGQIFRELQTRTSAANVAVIGLGAGSMAAYARPGEHWIFYEINPAVIRIAGDTNFFTFLADSGAAKLETVLGDARLRLREADEGQFDLIVLDAFSSDSIPVHLITREALRVYLAKLSPGGMLAFHISNRSLDLLPVVAALARDAGLVCMSQDENDPSPEEAREGKDQSHWVVLAPRKEDLGRLARDARWLPVREDREGQVWSDDFSNILSVLKWR